MIPRVDGDRLDGRRAVVTGGGRGFGERIAEQLAGLGATVAVLDVDLEAAERTAASVGGLAVRCDVGDEASVREAFARVRSELGPVDALVNNAGIASFTPFLQSSEEEFDTVFRVDYTSMFLTCREVVPAMLERRHGRIVNLSSVAGKRGGGFLGTAVYSSAKAGVLGFTKALAKEVGHAGVTVNAVAPSPASCSAIRSPNPRPPPVTTAQRPSRRSPSTLGIIGSGRQRRTEQRPACAPAPLQPLGSCSAARA